MRNSRRGYARYEKKLLSKSAARLDPILAITPGEPAGIGPDLICELKPGAFSNRLLIIADPDLLIHRAKQLGCSIELNVVSSAQDCIPGHLNVLPVKLATPAVSGQLDSSNGAYVVECLEQAVRLCSSQECAAMVTGPVNKAAINEAGISFSGHTEWLADRTHTPRVVMMLATEKLRVALVTTHLPLRQVPDAITEEAVSETLRILHEDLDKKFKIKEPRILVCGLNPHAGESGYLGREEIDVITPCMEDGRRQGMNLVGPLPADTAFTQEALDGADAVLAMYHDQGLPVLKHQGFGDAVNITLGLPLIRTSVDHGTALDIAGTGQAKPDSLITAIRLAERMSQSETTTS